MKKIEIEIEKCMAKSNPQETVRQHTDKLRNAARRLWQLKYIDDETYKLLLIVCEYHDYGKVNEEFQERIKNQSLFDEKKEIPHGILSTVFLNRDMFDNDDDYFIAMACVMLHHRIKNNIIEEYFNDTNLSKKIKEFAQEYTEENYERKYKSKRLIQIINSLKDDKTIRLKGLLHKCDYAASAGIEVEYENNFLLENLERLGYNWRSVQKYCIEQRENNLIIVAPTGMGKTEAGLLWMGNTKGFFVLPLKTAINAMYERIANGILNGERIENRLALLHGDMKMYYISNLDDENTDMEHYVKVSRQILGGKIAVITATLPPYIKEEIERVLDGDCMYANFMEEGKNRHNIRVLEKEINSQDIIEKYNELKKCKKSSKILVVCNSVEVAQDLYEELKDYNARLVHSKFIKKDRKKLEEQILECGKTYIDDEKQIIDNKSEIWISTSMVEASLDIDFDYLFTELNNLFSLFQRLGRCNRKGVKDDYKENYNCFVYTKPLGKVKRYLKNKDIFETSLKAIKNLDGIVSEKEKDDLINKYMTKDNLNLYYSKYEKVMDCLKKNEGDDNLNRKIREIDSINVIPKIIYDKYKEEIESLFIKVEGEIDFIEREKIIANIEEYCVNICKYEFNSEHKLFSKSIGKYIDIPILDCEYTEDMGFIKNSKSSKEHEEIRLESGGIFIE